MDFTDRYSTPLTSIFSRRHKLELEWRVELALLKSLATLNRIPRAAYDEISSLVQTNKITLERTLELEKETHHDIMAMVHALGEQSQYGEYVHLGATSQDINDTVLALQIKEAKIQLLSTLTRVRSQLTRLAKQYKHLVCIARTHGQHAIPTTTGHKFANFLYEFTIAQQYLERVTVVAKFSGAVGTFASLGTNEVQTLIMKELGLEAAPISTQTVSRLHIAELMFALASIATALERIGKEIRNLQRTEISETFEGFDKKQVGSSTMPQKRNPHKSERVCGLARIIRAQLQPSLETVSLEHERDLTNSAVERVTIPTACCLGMYCLMEMEKILSVLTVDEISVQKNLNWHNGKQLAERIMMALSTKLGRQTAHELLRVHSSRNDFVDALKNDEKIRSVLSEKEIDDLIDPTTYTGLAAQIVDQIVSQFGVDSVSTSSNSLTYASAGVSISAGDSLVQHIKPLAASTRRHGCDATLGGFGGLFDLTSLNYRNPVLVASTDGVGTKLHLAQLANKHDTIGIDLVAMSLNDLIVQGAEPLFFLDYFATSKLDVQQTIEVIRGVAEACRMCNCALIGGETAELPKMYKPKEYDLAGFAVGVVERESVLPRIHEIGVGDVVLGLASSGVHSNGFSLVRKIVKELNLDWNSKPPYESEEESLILDLLKPTKLYVKSLLHVLNSKSVRALAHITGGGLIENIPRVLSSEIQVEIDGSTWTLPPVFKWLSNGTKEGKVENEEMLRTFNCGIGMILIVEKSKAEEIKKLLEKENETVYEIGIVEKRQPKDGKQVIVTNQEKLFDNN